jgi:predicted lipoprotein with Yx(FWY)xxD motif
MGRHVAKAHLIIAMTVAIGATLVFGCGGSTDEDEGNGAVVSVSGAAKIGPILVDSTGKTLYEFRKDKGIKSECYEDCAKEVLPLLTDGSPRAERGAIAAKLGTTARKDGTTQVTYAGHPLYVWSRGVPGDLRGWGVNIYDARWFPLRPSGKPVEGGF